MQVDPRATKVWTPVFLSI